MNNWEYSFEQPEPCNGICNDYYFSCRYYDRRRKSCVCCLLQSYHNRRTTCISGMDSRNKDRTVSPALVRISHAEIDNVAVTVWLSDNLNLRSRIAIWHSSYATAVSVFRMFCILRIVMFLNIVTGLPNSSPMR